MGEKNGTTEERLSSYRRADDWERLAILEVRVNDHEEDIKHLVKHQERLADALDAINKTLLQIKWAVVGAGAIIVVHQMGILDAFLLILKGV